MAKWCFDKPIGKMSFGELADELMRIVDLAENYDVDVEAITRILDIIDERYPLDIVPKSAEESWADFCKCYIELTQDSECT